MDFTKDVTISLDQLSRLSDVVRKIRSTVRFLLGNVYRGEGNLIIDDDFELPYDDLPLIEKFMLNLLYEFQRSIQGAYNQNDFKQVVQLTTQFTTNTLSALYFETVKDTLYSNAEDDLERRQVIYVMSRILKIYKLAIAPILPHLAEEIVLHEKSDGFTPGGSRPRSFFEECWPALCEEWKDDRLSDQMEFLISIRDSILRQSEALRQEKKFRTMEELELVVDGSDSIRNSSSGVSRLSFLETNAESLTRWFNVSDLTISKSAHVTRTVLNLASPAWQHSFEFKYGGVKEQEDPLTRRFEPSTILPSHPSLPSFLGPIPTDPHHSISTSLSKFLPSLPIRLSSSINTVLSLSLARSLAIGSCSVKLFLIPAWRSKCPRCWKFTVEDRDEVCDRCRRVLSIDH